MQTWTVVGARRTTGQEGEWSFVAETQADAVEQANRAGILVSAVRQPVRVLYSGEGEVPPQFIVPASAWRVYGVLAESGLNGQWVVSAETESLARDLAVRHGIIVNAIAPTGESISAGLAVSQSGRRRRGPQRRTIAALGVILFAAALVVPPWQVRTQTAPGEFSRSITFRPWFAPPQADPVFSSWGMEPGRLPWFSIWWSLLVSIPAVTLCGILLAPGREE